MLILTPYFEHMKNRYFIQFANGKTLVVDYLPNWRVEELERSYNSEIIYVTKS